MATAIVMISSLEVCYNSGGLQRFWEIIELQRGEFSSWKEFLVSRQQETLVPLMLKKSSSMIKRMMCMIRETICPNFFSHIIQICILHGVDLRQTMIYHSCPFACVFEFVILCWRRFFFTTCKLRCISSTKGDKKMTNKLHAFVALTIPCFRRGWLR